MDLWNVPMTSRRINTAYPLSNLSEERSVVLGMTNQLYSILYGEVEHGTSQVIRAHFHSQLVRLTIVDRLYYYTMTERRP